MSQIIFKVLNKMPIVKSSNVLRLSLRVDHNVVPLKYINEWLNVTN